MTPILLLGGGGHCRSVIDVIESGSQFRVRGVVQPADAGRADVLGYPVLGTDDCLPQLLAGGAAALVTVGQIRSAAVRCRLYSQLLACQAQLPILVSPLAHVSRHAQLGAGSVVMHGAMVNAAAIVGVNAIVNSQALIEHDAVIGDHCHIATGARVNGGAVLGDGAFVGSGAIVLPGVRVAERCVIGAGVVVDRDLVAGTVVKRRERQHGE